MLFTCNTPALIGLVKALLKDQFLVNENLNVSLKKYQFMFSQPGSRTDSRKNMNLELDKPNDLLRNKVLPIQILSPGTEVKVLRNMVHMNNVFKHLCYSKSLKTDWRPQQKYTKLKQVKKEQTQKKEWGGGECTRVNVI
jgi:hypothetical protein